MAVLESENELENFLVELYNSDEWPLPGGGQLFRQVKVSTYGIIDLITVEIEAGVKVPNICVTIYELKKGKIDLTAVGQISRYKTAVERFLDASVRNGRGEKIYDYTVFGVLVGDGYANGDVCFVVDNADWLCFYEYELSLKGGIGFNHDEGWKNTDEDLTSLPLAKDLFRDFVFALKDSRRYEKADRSRKERIKNIRKQQELNEICDIYNVNDGTPT
jgi:hypothetical protein